MNNIKGIISNYVWKYEYFNNKNVAGVICESTV